ncbi:MAG: hypothetical protein LC734_02560 [Acidobacteria bacterium]|nr:hypothetical protein [Acidobacteriota bacterium]
MNSKSFSNIKREDITRIRGGLGKIGIEMPKGDDVEVKGLPSVMQSCGG